MPEVPDAPVSLKIVRINGAESFDPNQPRDEAGMWTVYRAGDSSERGVKAWASFSQQESTAKAYLDNPGFGGKTLRKVSAPMGKVLDADVRSRSGMRALAKEIGLDEEEGEEWFKSGYQYPWEESSKVKQALGSTDYNWVRYVDDFPAGAKTVVPLKSFDLSERDNSVAAERFSKSERLNFAPATGAGKRFRCNFIEPGVVDYSDIGMGTELLRKKTIDEALNSMMGKPVTMGHVPTDKPAPANRIVGRVDNVGYDPESGMHFCEGSVDTEEGRAAMRSGLPSCGYRVNKTLNEPKTSHNIPYERELTGIEFHHLAIVDNPRYEDATFRLNSKGKPVMFKWIKKLVGKDAEGKDTQTERVNDIAPETVVEVDGQPVPLKDVIAAHRANQKPDPIAADDEIEIDGERVKMADAVAAYRENAKKIADAAKAKKDEEDAKAAAELERVNAAKARGQEFFQTLATAKHKAEVAPTERRNSSGSVAECVARGNERYGPINGAN